MKIWTEMSHWSLFICRLSQFKISFAEWIHQHFDYFDRFFEWYRIWRPPGKPPLNFLIKSRQITKNIGWNELKVEINGKLVKIDLKNGFFQRRPTKITWNFVKMENKSDF